MDWWLIVVIVAGTAAVCFTVGVSIRFDFNTWLASREKRRAEKLQQLCPHVMIESAPEAGERMLVFQSLFVSPPGTVNWICQRCGGVSMHEQFVDHNTRYWYNNLDEYLRVMKQMNRLRRK